MVIDRHETCRAEDNPSCNPFKLSCHRNTIHITHLPKKKNNSLPISPKSIYTNSHPISSTDCVISSSFPTIWWVNLMTKIVSNWLAQSHQLNPLQGCTLVTLPECFSFIGAQKGEAQEAAESLEGPTMARASEKVLKTGKDTGPLKINEYPLNKKDHFKRKIVFQPSFFRGIYE